MTSHAPKIWHNGNIIPWENATIHVMSHGLHYGSGVFEGIKCYEGAKTTLIFRLKDHIDRLFQSAKIHNIEIPFSKTTYAHSLSLTNGVVRSPS